jgi:dihydrofolate reductase
MGKIVIDMSMSLDGYINAPGETPEIPLGKGGLRLHAWMEDQEAFNRVYTETPGAVIMGRTTYDNSLPWWNGKGPAGDTPCFVLTHEPPTDASDVFTFVTDGIESALEQARKVADDKLIGLMGANTDQQFLNAGLVDEIRIHLIPLLLGAGTPLFANIDHDFELEKTNELDMPNVTHLTYRIKNNNVS